MRIAVATTFTKEGYELHGKAFIASFQKHWEAELYTYAEGFELDGRELNSPEVVAFKERYKDRPLAHGRIRDGYYYTFDAVKWSHRIFALKMAMDDANPDILINIDSDIVTFADITNEFLIDLLGNADLAYMPRKSLGMYSECSFVIYRLPECRQFINDHIDMYMSGEIFKLPGWTDCHAFDHLLKTSGLKTKDINKGIPPSMHPFVNGPLGKYMDHLKGGRKKEGRSRKSDLVVKREEAYWQ